MSEQQQNQTGWTGSLTLGDGSVVTGATMEEAFQNLAKMKVDTANALKAEREAKAAAEAEKNVYAQQLQQRQEPKPKGNNGDFDKEEYYRLLNADPVAANDYYFQYRFGRSPEEFNNEYQRYGQTVSVLEQQTMAAAFAAQHAEDWPASPEAAKALRSRVEQLTGSGIPFNLDTMNYAYSQLVDEGTIKPVEKKEEERPNPALSGTGQVTVPDDIKNAATLSDADLMKLMKKHGMLQ